MKADPTIQWRLLDLQALDTRVDQIAHRRAHLKESAEYDRVAALVVALESDLVRARTAYDDIQAEVAKAEADVQLVRDRTARNNARLDSGQGTAKDLQALQHELTSLARRQSELEDIELEIMEKSEALGTEVARIEARSRELTAELEAAARARDAILATLDEEEKALVHQRADIVPAITGDLLALYEKIRTQSGTGAAALYQRRCEGCRLELVGADMARIAKAAPDEVLRCEECRRILVRTSESGV